MFWQMVLKTKGIHISVFQCARVVRYHALSQAMHAQLCSPATRETGAPRFARGVASPPGFSRGADSILLAVFSPLFCPFAVFQK
jgi:hypothetical protein